MNGQTNDQSVIVESIVDLAAARVDPPLEEGARAAMKRGRILRIKRRVMLVCTGALLVAGLVVPLSTLAPIRSRSPERNVLGAPIAVGAAATDIIPVGQSPRGLAVGAEGVWVTTSPENGTCTGTVHQIDRNTGEVVASVPIDVSPNGMAMAEGSVWVVGDTCAEGEAPGGAVTRVDASTATVRATVALGPIPFDIAVSDGLVWVTRDIDGRTGELIQIDPLTDEVTLRIPLEGRVRSLVAGYGSVWVNDSTSTGDEGPSLIRVDAETGEVVERVKDVAGSFLALGYGQLWTNTSAGHGSAAASIDVATGQVSRPIAVNTVFRPFAVGFGGVWFISGPGSEAAGEGVCRLNPTTGEVDICIDHGSTSYVWLDPAASDEQIGAIWVANDEATVTRINLEFDPDSDGGP